MTIQDSAGQELSIGDHVVYGSRSKTTNSLEKGIITGFTQAGYVTLSGWRTRTIQSSTTNLIKIPADVAKNWGQGVNTLDAKTATKGKSKITV